MIDKLENSTRMYTDIQGLQQLKTNYAKDAEGVKQAIAEQFQSMLMQMMLKSMRDANKAFESDLFSTDQMEFYTDMFDKQLSLSMASSHNEFTEAIKRSIDNHGAPLPSTTTLDDEIALREKPAQLHMVQNMPHPTYKKVADEDTTPPPSFIQELTDSHLFSSPKEFVEHIWPLAKQAANTIGVDPKLLVAQAALETSWGKNIISHNNQSTHNLFNIKATADWTAPRVKKDTLEQQDGILVKQSAEFRSYPSILDSFKDYVHFLKSHDRYAQALQHTGNPEAFAQGLQKAGYATDKNYADKILKIFSGDTLKQLINRIDT